MIRELDTECAQAMGDVSPGGMYWHAIQETHAMFPAPYSGDHATARLLEDEIERRGLQEKYIRCLERVMSMSTIGLISDWRAFQLLRATPEQRARAFLKAVEDA